MKSNKKISISLLLLPFPRRIQAAVFAILLFVPAFSWFGCSSGNANETGPKNLVVIMVDALRQDHLGVYGYKRNTSPNIDRFAADSLIIDNAISQSGWTAPSIMALFSSNYPKNDLNHSSTFAQWLQKNNYQTAAFASNPILIPKMGYNKGFQTYNLKDWAKGPEIVDWTLNWLDTRDKTKPFCLYLHFMDVHDPYTPPKEFAEKFCAPYNGPVTGNVVEYKKKMAKKEPLDLSERDIKQLLDLYDGDIAHMDHQFARLIAGLKKAGVYENAIIVFLADHGDEFMEHHGIGHGHTVYDELIRVPLIIKGFKKLHGKRYTGLFELIDLAPTLLDMMGIPLNYKVTGRSFANHLEKNKPLKKMTFSEVHRTVGLRAGSWFVSARTLTEKAIYNPNIKQFTFFNLTKDKEEKAPQKVLPGRIMPFLTKSLQQWRKVFGSTGNPKQYDPEAMKALRSLGYL